MFSSYGEILTVKELCEMLLVSRNTAYTLLKNDEIKHSTVGRQIRIKKDDVLDYLECRQKPS